MAAVLLGLCGVAAGVRAWQRLHAFTPVAHPFAVPTATAERLPPFRQAVIDDLRRQVAANIRYQDGYYVGGEPPPGIGVCTDVLVRSYRAAGVDVRQLVAEDVRIHPQAYGVTRPDPNIDHRRCRNLIVFFRRQARTLPSDGPSADWQPGDVVFWSTRANGYTDHVGLVSTGRDVSGEPTVVHHWPGLPVSETDGLHRFQVMGHFRWTRPRSTSRRTRQSHNLPAQTDRST